MDTLHKNVSSLSISRDDDEDNSEDMECSICHEKADKMCSACKTVAYCSVDHQKADWKSHKKVCQPFFIKKIEGMGMGCVATKDIKAGEMVMEDTPIIQAPSWNYWSCTPEEGRSCLACGNKMDKMRACSTCHWPICSVHCEQNPLHKNNECPEFVSRKIKYPAPRGWHDGMLTMFIRANVMKAREPKKFAQLMALQDFHVIPSSHQQLQEDAQLPAGMYDILKGPNCLDLAEFRKLLRICMINSIQCGFNEGNGTDNLVCMIFLKAARMNHSCFPNCRTIFSPGKIRVFTSLPVTKGEQLFYCFYECCTVLPTTTRQSHINSGGFICKCKRCVDPTELGTFLSGIKCFNCSRYLSANSDDDDVGFLLPADPLYSSEDPVYECHRCHVKAPYSKVMKLLPSVVQRGLRNVDKWTDHTGPTDDISSLETLLNQMEKEPKFMEYLHRTHGILHRALRPVIQAQEKHLNVMSAEDLKKRMRRLEFLLLIDDKLFPGLTKMRLGDLKMMERTCLRLRCYPGQLTAEEKQELHLILQRIQAEELKFTDIELSSVPKSQKMSVMFSLKLAEAIGKSLHLAD